MSKREANSEGKKAFSLQLSAPFSQLLERNEANFESHCIAYIKLDTLK